MNGNIYNTAIRSELCDAIRSELCECAIWS